MELNFERIASTVVGSSGGAYVKRYFDIDCFKFPWVELFIRDEILRKKIQELQSEIQDFRKLPIHKDELKASFKSAIASIRNDRMMWFENWLKKMQSREVYGLTSDNLLANKYIPVIDLTEKEIDVILSKLPEEGVRQKDIDAKIKKNQADIEKSQKIIENELSPADRWKYEDNGKPIPYPQGCQWTQYVRAWRIVASRFDGPVSVEGLAIKNDSEQSAYIALGLNSIRKVSLRTPGRS